jgi:hypothetical protein
MDFSGTILGMTDLIPALVSKLGSDAPLGNALWNNFVQPRLDTYIARLNRNRCTQLSALVAGGDLLGHQREPAGTARTPARTRSLQRSVCPAISLADAQGGEARHRQGADGVEVESDR